MPPRRAADRDGQTKCFPRDKFTEKVGVVLVGNEYFCGARFRVLGLNAHCAFLAGRKCIESLMRNDCFGFDCAPCKRSAFEYFL